MTSSWTHHLTSKPVTSAGLDWYFSGFTPSQTILTDYSVHILHYRQKHTTMHIKTGQKGNNGSALNSIIPAAVSTALQ